jgi:D-methionine transport system substrate-binding protein
VRCLALLCIGASLAGCGNKSTSNRALKVGVTPVPAGEVMAQILPDLKAQGVDVSIVSFSDYVQPDVALAAGDIDANLYQNVPFMDQFNRDHGTKLVSVTRVYMPAMALYPGRTKSLTALPPHGKIAIPNDPVNSGRALVLLQSAGLIVLKQQDGQTVTIHDVASNPKDLEFNELEAAQLPRALQDVDAAVINANYALDAGLNPVTGALYQESPQSPYANILAVNAGKEQDARVLAVAKALKSPKVKAFLETRYKGSVFPAW